MTYYDYGTREPVVSQPIEVPPDFSFRPCQTCTWEKNTSKDCNSLCYHCNQHSENRCLCSPDKLLLCNLCRQIRIFQNDRHQWAETRFRTSPKFYFIPCHGCTDKSEDLLCPECYQGGVRERCISNRLEACKTCRFCRQMKIFKEMFDEFESLYDF